MTSILLNTVQVCGLCALILSGCTGAAGPAGGTTATYSLNLVIEKNLDLNYDYAYTEFLREGLSVPGGFVIIGNDTLRVDASGKASAQFNPGTWSHGQPVAIRAADTAKGFVYQTTVTIPGTFYISNFIPNTRLWQPNKANPRVEWAPANGAANYVVSLQASLPSSPSRGQAMVAGSLSQTFTPDAFYDPNTNALVTGVYYVHVVAYNPTFFLRPNANYRLPDFNFPLTVDTKDIRGMVTALVVSARDSIVVSPSP